MTTKELICAEIVRRMALYDVFYTSAGKELKGLLSFLDTLPDESEQPTRGYDEAYLNEKIAKASKSWEGVDVDKFMDEIRGREPITTCNELAEAAEAYSRQVSRGHNYRDLTCGFKAGAEWMKRKMTEGAVEGVVYRYESYQKIATAIIVDVPKESLDNKVRIIIVKEEEQ